MSEYKTGRQAHAGVSALFVDRWSPRALDNTPIATDVLTRIFEAARWTPSAYNEQPWRFYTSSEQTFSDYLELLVEGNQAWAKNAGLIGFIVGKKQFDKNGNDNACYMLDCGAAWMAMTLQARMEGLYTHGMAGIKHASVLEYLGLSGEQYGAVMGFTLAHKASVNPEDSDSPQEQPNDRKPLAEIWLR